MKTIQIGLLFTGVLILQACNHQKSPTSNVTAGDSPAASAASPQSGVPTVSPAPERDSSSGNANSGAPATATPSYSEPLMNRSVKLGYGDVQFLDPNELHAEVKKEMRSIETTGLNYSRTSEVKYSYRVEVYQKEFSIQTIDSIVGGSLLGDNGYLYEAAARGINENIFRARTLQVLIAKDERTSRVSVSDWLNYVAQYRVTDLALRATRDDLEKYLVRREGSGYVTGCQTTVDLRYAKFSGPIPANLNLCASIPGTTDFICKAASVTKVNDDNSVFLGGYNFKYLSKREGGKDFPDVGVFGDYKTDTVPTQLWVSLQGRNAGRRDAEWEILRGTMNIEQDCQVLRGSSTQSMSGEFITWRDCTLTDAPSGVSVTISVNTTCQRSL